MASEKAVKKLIYNYYRRNGRHGLAWRKTRDPYRILVSEIMLQQTQVSRVEEYYRTFLKQFPSLHALASARTADVLRAWQGLGYNRRALALQRCAKIIVEELGGRVPDHRADLEALPGIGKYTAGALLVFAFNKPEVMIETNIRRVFIHFFFPSRANVTDVQLERCIKRMLDKKNPREWYFALMDYGAMLGREGKVLGVNQNPNRQSAHYKKQSRFEGSRRELRGKILRLSLAKASISSGSLALKLKRPKGEINAALSGLRKEGLIN